MKDQSQALQDKMKKAKADARAQKPGPKIEEIDDDPMGMDVDEEEPPAQGSAAGAKSDMGMVKDFDPYGEYQDQFGDDYRLTERLVVPARDFCHPSLFLFLFSLSRNG